MSHPYRTAPPLPPPPPKPTLWCRLGLHRWAPRLTDCQVGDDHRHERCVRPGCTRERDDLRAGLSYELAGLILPCRYPAAPWPGVQMKTKRTVVEVHVVVNGVGEVLLQTRREVQELKAARRSRP